jgi:methyltransferase
MNGAVALLTFITFQRFIEFIWDRQNTQRLRAAGAIEFGGLHYPAVMLVHAAWLAGLWVLGYDHNVVPAYLIAFLVLQIARYWVLWTLGRRWSTRVIVLPGAALIESGPYRLMRHPNYVVVAGELVLAPLALGMPVYALVFLALYAGAAYLRIQVENSALTWAPGEPEVRSAEARRPT